jgi:hypothetical protein
MPSENGTGQLGDRGRVGKVSGSRIGPYHTPTPTFRIPVTIGKKAHFWQERPGSGTSSSSTVRLVDRTLDYLTETLDGLAVVDSVLGLPITYGGNSGNTLSRPITYRYVDEFLPICLSL